MLDVSCPNNTKEQVESYEASGTTTVVLEAGAQRSGKMDYLVITEAEPFLETADDFFQYIWYTLIIVIVGRKH